jgi:hypothetical protein
LFKAQQLRALCGNSGQSKNRRWRELDNERASESEGEEEILKREERDSLLESLGIDADSSEESEWSEWDEEDDLNGALNFKA